MTDKVKVRLSFIINITFFAVVALLVYLTFKYLIGWLLPFILAFSIVSLINPLIRVIKKNLRIKQEVVSLIVMILIYALVAVLLFLLIMQIVFLIRDALEVLPDYYTEILQPAFVRANNSVSYFLQNLPQEWQDLIVSIQDAVINAVNTLILDFSSRGVSILSGLTTRIPSFLIAFFFTIMLSFFISMQYEKVIDFFRVQCSPKVKNFIRDLRGIIASTIVKYLRAAFTMMMITFVELSIGLIILNTDNAIPYAFGIAIFDALPFFGTGAIMIPWFIIELLQANYHFAFGLIILYAIVTVIRNMIESKIVGDKLGLNPIVSITAIYLGFKVFGVLGMIFMPMLTQIVMELHHNGTIRIFKERVNKSEEPTNLEE